MLPKDKKDAEEEEVVYILPDNWKIFLVFEFLLTQWRVTESGAMGLDYNVIPLALDVNDVDEGEDKKEVIHGVRVMESTALSIMSEERKKILQENKRKQNKR